MLRARYPLAAAVLAASIALVPASSALAAGEDGAAPPLPPATSQLTGSDGSGSSGSASSADTGSTGSSTGGSSSSQTGSTGTGNSNPSLPDISGSDAQSSNPLTQLQDGFSQFQNSSSGSGSQQPDVAGALQTFGTCLQSAGSSATPFLDGQKCVENLVKAISKDDRANCASQNNFTLQFLIDRLKSGQPPSDADSEQFQKNLTGLLSCLTAAQESSEAPAVSNSGGAEAETPAPVSDEAPAATPVSGTPNFTG